MIGRDPTALRRHLRLYWVLGPDPKRDDQEVIDRLDQGIDGGVSFVQWRDKSPPNDARNDSLPKRLRDRCAKARIPFVINDNVQLAIQLGADGVHLGQEDMAPNQARALLGPDAIIGLSVGNDAETRRFDRTIVDYVGVGPLYNTATKADAGEALGWTAANTLVDAHNLGPAVLIGGITVDRLRAEPAPSDTTAKGIAGIAVVSALSNATHPAQSAKSLMATLSLYLP